MILVIIWLRLLPCTCSRNFKGNRHETKKHNLFWSNCVARFGKTCYRRNHWCPLKEAPKGACLNNKLFQCLGCCMPLLYPPQPSPPPPPVTFFLMYAYDPGPYVVQHVNISQQRTRSSGGGYLDVPWFQGFTGTVQPKFEICCSFTRPMNRRVLPPKVMNPQ